MKKTEEQFFETLLYENVSDGFFRKKFINAGGFCSRHAYTFIQYNDGLAVNIMYETIFHEAVEELKIPLLKKKPGRKDTFYPYNKSCPACIKELKAEEEFFYITKNFIDDEDFTDKFLQSEGMCMNHYKNFLIYSKMSPPPWFEDFHLKKYERIQTGIRAYIDECNYSLKESPSLTRKELLEYREIIKNLYGYPYHKK